MSNEKVKFEGLTGDITVVEPRYVVIVNGLFVSIADTLGDAEDDANDHLNDLVEKDHVENISEAQVQIFATVQHLCTDNARTSEDDIKLAIKEDFGTFDPGIDMDNDEWDDETLEITSGEYRGTRFSDYYELNNFLRDKLYDQDLTIEEIQATDVERVRRKTATLTDACHDKGNVSITFEGTPPSVDANYISLTSEVATALNGYKPTAFDNEGTAEQFEPITETELTGAAFLAAQNKEYPQLYKRVDLKRIDLSRIE